MTQYLDLQTELYQLPRARTDIVPKRTIELADITAGGDTLDWHHWRPNVASTKKLNFLSIRRFQPTANFCALKKGAVEIPRPLCGIRHIRVPMSNFCRLNVDY